MSSNNRIFYACQAVAIAKEGAGNASEPLAPANMAHGVQSVGITTNFNLEQAFELAQIEIYENIEGTPDVEVTLEKVLDGHPLLYHLATTGMYGGGQTGIAARADEKCDVHLGIFDAAANNVASATANGGGAEVEVYCSGMYISSVSYSIPVDGNATESITLVGNNKEWLSSDHSSLHSFTPGGGGSNVAIGNDDVAGFDGSDSPSAKAGASGGIQRREDVILSGCILPQSINGVRASGYANALAVGSEYGNITNLVHLQSFSCSTDFGREDILELGRKTPYFRPANFPVEVTCEIEAITTSGDFVGAYEFGDPALHATDSSGDNLVDECIFVLTRAGYAFDLGNKNKLSSVSYGGGDAGGGNVSVTYSYSNFNQLDVQHFSHEGRIGFGGVTVGAGFDGDGFAQDKGVGAFPGYLQNGGALLTNV
tara:strand:- start:1362 stop:2639 length:1278 start_codon:yes stop_codon:yes gene_type:complete